VVIDKPNKFPSLLVLTGGFDKGGAERRTTHLIRFLCSEGYNVHIGTFSSEHHSNNMKKFQYSSLTYLGKRGMTTLIPIVRIIKLLLSTKPDIVFSNLRRVNVVLMMVKILFPFDNVIFIVGVSNNPEYHPNPLFTRLLYKHADGLIANSHGTKNYLCNEWGLSEKDVHVIQNGVQSNEITLLAKDDSLFEWYKESLPTIITIGRLSSQKNHACLIKSFSIVRERTQSRLVIIGEGPLRESLERLAKSLGVAENTWFTGYQDNPYKFLARSTSTLFVLSSKWEGFPNVLLEAMVCGVPVISTDVDFGPREIIDHGKTGFLVSSDDPEILADQILYILENRSKQTIGGIIKNARKKVAAEFSLEVMIKNYQEYFLDVYNSHNVDLY